MLLAPYACDPQQSRGRRFAQASSPYRSEYQRDRDRIVHSTAFRRLVYKTQVFLNHEGDLFRTRLTHSLEVAQLARSVARTLALNEDLVEAIALAHDVGHTPFGHAGQDALNDCMADFGGFEHNLQSLRIVDHLEQRYPQFDGLNLCFETREGILKHCTRQRALVLEQAEPGGVGRRFLQQSQPSLEAQLCNLADQIAYNTHDLDDGVRSGLLTLEQLQQLLPFEQCRRQALRDYPELKGRRLLYESLRRLLNGQINDLIVSSQKALARVQPADVAAVRASAPLVRFSDAMRAQIKALKVFLFAHLYRHPQVAATSAKAQQVVRELFAAYLDTPHELPPSYVPAAHSAAVPDDRHHVARAVADYIAGMTDRFALREHERLTGLRLLI